MILLHVFFNPFIMFSSVSATCTIEKMEETRDFYKKHFGAEIVYFCESGQYMIFKIGSSELHFMKANESSKKTDVSTFNFNFYVKDVNTAYKCLVTDNGLTSYQCTEDGKCTESCGPKEQPWGGIAFNVKDPNGILLYVYNCDDCKSCSSDCKSCCQ